MVNEEVSCSPKSNNSTLDIIHTSGAACESHEDGPSPHNFWNLTQEGEHSMQEVPVLQAAGAFETADVSNTGGDAHAQTFQPAQQNLTKGDLRCESQMQSCLVYR